MPPIIHYSTEEPFTKYEICLVFARILGLPHAHITPDAGPPPPGTNDLRCIIFSPTLMDLHLSISHLVSFSLFGKQGLHHARRTRNYICVRRKTWASKVDLGQAALRNGGRIISAITRRDLSPHGVGKRESVDAEQCVNLTKSRSIACWPLFVQCGECA